jgi:hypothetical protein
MIHRLTNVRTKKQNASRGASVYNVRIRAAKTEISV